MTGDQGITAVKVWDASITGGGELANVKGVPYGDPVFGAVDFTADGRGVVVGQPEGVSILDIETGDRRATIGPRSPDAEIVSFALSGDGRLLATTGAYGPVDVWDASTGDHQFAVSEVDLGDGGFVRGLEWSHASDLLAVLVNSDRAGRVVVVNRSGAEVATVHEEPGHRVESVSFSPDDRLLATTRFGIARVDPTNMPVSIWDWERGEVVRTIGTSARRVVFDPTGTHIVTSRFVEGVADVWDAQTGDRVTTLAAPAEIGGLTYSPDGMTVATAHGDGTVRLWDPETGVQQLVLGGDGTRMSHVEFGPHGSALASVGDDGIVHVWALDLDDLIDIARDRLARTGRTLSDDECRQYLHVDRCPRGLSLLTG
jgi:WD40 repeat protein